MKSEKRKVTIDNLLQNIICLYIVFLPILDIISFLFRNKLGLNSSPITYIRPLMLISMIVLFFFLLNKKSKVKLIIYNIVILIYAFVHMYIFKKGMQGATIYPLKEELRYIAYYAFGGNIIFLIILKLKEEFLANTYNYDIKINKDSGIKINDKVFLKNKYKWSILITSFIYIIILYLTMITKTASYTYSDSKTGYKGFFESGNVLSNVLVFLEILVFIIFSKEKKENIKTKIFAGLNFFLLAIYNFIFLGTRTGKYSTILLMIVYMMAYIFCKIRNYILNKKYICENKNKSNLLKMVIMFFAIVIFLGASILIVKKYKNNINIASNKRREYLEENQKQLLTEDKQKLSVTLEIHNLNKKIKNHEISESFLSKNEQEALIETEEIAISKNLTGHDRRKAQTIYNFILVKKQKSILNILFGKGHLLSYGEMTLEREILAIPMDFGLIGFTLFLVPYIFLAIQIILLAFRYMRYINIEYIISIYGILLAFILSYAAGAVYYPMASSFMLAIIYSMSFKILKDILNNLKEKQTY